MEKIVVRSLRELDAMVAKAIGWTWNDLTAYSPTGGSWARYNSTGKDSGWLPYYSSDIGAAWQAIELVMNPQKPQEGQVLPPNTKLGYWFQRSAYELACSSAEDAAQYICLAILECMGMNVELELEEDDRQNADSPTAYEAFVQPPDRGDTLPYRGPDGSVVPQEDWEVVRSPFTGHITSVRVTGEAAEQIKQMTSGFTPPLISVGYQCSIEQDGSMEAVLRQQLEEVRETNRRLNRRCQHLEHLISSAHNTVKGQIRELNGHTARARDYANFLRDLWRSNLRNVHADYEKEWKRLPIPYGSADGIRMRVNEALRLIGDRQSQ